MGVWFSQYPVLISLLAALVTGLVVGVIFWLAMRRSKSELLKQLYNLTTVMRRDSFPQPVPRLDVQAFSDSIERTLNNNFHSIHEQLNMLLSRVSRIEEPKEMELSQAIPDTSMKERFDVFLSYASSDQEQANELYEAITTAGGRIFLSAKTLMPGEDFADEIRKALSDSCEVWLLLSPTSLKSDWVVSEWGAAWVLEKRIIPILHRCSPDGLPDRIRRLQCIDYYKYPDLVKRMSLRHP